MTLARPYATTDPLYSLDALRRNRQVVRQWIEDDLLVRRCVGDLSSHKTRKQISLLTHFGEPPDLEILWRKAEQGFPLPPPPPQGTRVEPDPRIEQRELCFYLIINGILWTCIDVAGGEVEGLRMYHKGFRERKIAPEVREAYEEGLAMSAGQPKE